jgi:hypothetical protein
MQSFVARFPIPRKSPAVVTLPVDLNAAEMDMLTGMLAMLANRFKQHEAERRFLAFWRGYLVPSAPLLTFAPTTDEGK